LVHCNNGAAMLETAFLASCEWWLMLTPSAGVPK
jgi:hypothetical protein